MQMPDKWEDSYVFVEDFYDHFAGKRRMTMYDAAQTMRRLFGPDFAFDCPGIQIGRRGKVSYQTLRTWLEAGGDEGEWAFDDLLPDDPVMLPWGFAEWFAQGSDASLDIVKRRAEEFADFATGAIGREGLRICPYPEPDLHAIIRMRERLPGFEAALLARFELDLSADNIMYESWIASLGMATDPLEYGDAERVREKRMEHFAKWIVDAQQRLSPEEKALLFEGLAAASASPCRVLSDLAALP